MAKLEQERAEQQRKKDEEALRRRKEHLRRIKRMLEAAFDGDTDEIRKLLREVSGYGDTYTYLAGKGKTTECPLYV